MTLQERVDEFCDSTELLRLDWDGYQKRLLALLQSVRDDAYAAGRSEALEEAAKLICYACRKEMDHDLYEECEAISIRSLKSTGNTAAGGGNS